MELLKPDQPVESDSDNIAQITSVLSAPILSFLKTLDDKAGSTLSESDAISEDLELLPVTFTNPKFNDFTGDISATNSWTATGDSDSDDN